MAAQPSSSRVARGDFKIEEITTDDPYFKAKIKLLEEEVISGDPDFQCDGEQHQRPRQPDRQSSPNLPSEAAIILKNIENPSFLVQFVSSNLNSDLKENKTPGDQQPQSEGWVTDEPDAYRTSVRWIENKVTNKTRAELDKQQRDYFLQQQMKAIKDELGGENVAEVKEMTKRRIAQSAAAKECSTKVLRIGAHASINPWLFGCLQSPRLTCLIFPGKNIPKIHTISVKQEKSSDHDHYGMDKIKERILPRCIETERRYESPILCFIGPPGNRKNKSG